MPPTRQRYAGLEVREYRELPHVFARRSGGLASLRDDGILTPALFEAKTAELLERL